MTKKNVMYLLHKVLISQSSKVYLNKRYKWIHKIFLKNLLLKISEEQLEYILKRNLKYCSNKFTRKKHNRQTD